MTEDILFRYISGNANPDEKQEVWTWEKGDEERKKELLRLRNVWVLAGLEGDVDQKKRETGIRQVLNMVIKSDIKEKKKTIRFRYLRYAAAILFLVALSGTIGYYISHYTTTTENQYTEIIASNGQRTTVMLPDGSKVQLNSESRLRFPSSFKSGQRKVTMVGEAFFDIVPDKSRPFVVEMQDLSVEVLGTSFNISCYPNDSLITTYLEQGKVKITKAKADDIFLSPSEAYFYNKLTQKSKKQIIQDKRLSDWTRGKLTISSETIGELAKKLERRFNVQIEFGDSEAKDHTYSGSIKDEDINTLLEALVYASSIEYKRSGETITLYSKKKEKK